MYTTQLWFLFHFFYWHPILPWDFNTNSPYAFLIQSYKVRPLCLIISGLKTGLLCFFSDLIINSSQNKILSDKFTETGSWHMLVGLAAFCFADKTKHNPSPPPPPPPTQGH